MKSKISDFLKYLETFKGVRESSLKSYRSILREFSGFPLSSEGFQEYLEHISSARDSTRRKKLTVVKSYLSWLKERGYYEGEEFWKSARPPRHHPLPHYLTKEELSRFLSAIDEWYWKVLFKLLASTGMRVSELLELSMQDVEIRGRSAKLRIRGKGHKERVIRVPASVVKDAIAAGVFDRKPSARTIQRKMREYAKRAGIEKHVTPHSLRHTFAIALLEKGVPLNRIQQILGHSNIATTSIYLALSADELEVPSVV